LIITGYPISLEILRISLSSSTSPKKPGTVLTPAFYAIFFDSILSPMATMDLACGPINLISFVSKRAWNFAFSDRKP